MGRNVALPEHREGRNPGQWPGDEHQAHSPYRLPCGYCRAAWDERDLLICEGLLSGRRGLQVVGGFGRPLGLFGFQAQVFEWCVSRQVGLRDSRASNQSRASGVTARSIHRRMVARFSDGTAHTVSTGCGIAVRGVQFSQKTGWAEVF